MGRVSQRLNDRLKQAENRFKSKLSQEIERVSVQNQSLLMTAMGPTEHQEEENCFKLKQKYQKVADQIGFDLQDQT